MIDSTDAVLAASLVADTPLLSDAQRDEIVTLGRSSDSVELKLTIPAADHRATLMALDVDPLEAEIRVVYFFDTPDLTLNRNGVVVRARRSQRKGDDSVVKLRPVQPAHLTPALRASENFVVEVDAMPGSYVCSGSLKRALPKPVVNEVAHDRAPVRKIFSKEQRNFFAEHAPAGIGLDDLTILGPIFVLKLRARFPDFARKMVAEMWMYPDQTRIVELSTKSAPADALTVVEEARAFLQARGVVLTGAQETKTKRALEFFAAAAPEAG